MLALAERAIEEELGVETSSTVYRKHLYELAGFKAIFGTQIVDQLVRGEETKGEPEIEIPHIDVRIRGKSPYAPLSKLACKAVGHHGHLVKMRFASQDERVHIRFELDFSQERLNFDVLRDFGRIRDDGSPEAADTFAECSRSFKEYFGHGQLYIFNSLTGDLIARKDAFIPINMMQDVDAANHQIANWRCVATARRERDLRFGSEMIRLAQTYNVIIDGMSHLLA
jgi:hypothetical protein